MSITVESFSFAVTSQVESNKSIVLNLDLCCALEQRKLSCERRGTRGLYSLSRLTATEPEPAAGRQESDEGKHVHDILLSNSSQRDLAGAHNQWEETRQVWLYIQQQSGNGIAAALLKPLY